MTVRQRGLQLMGPHTAALLVVGVLLTVALLGYDGGEIVRQGVADFPVVVHCDYIPRIQEVQASVYHIIRELLEVLGRDEA